MARILWVEAREFVRRASLTYNILMIAFFYHGISYSEKQQEIFFKSLKQIIFWGKRSSEESTTNLYIFKGSEMTRLIQTPCWFPPTERVRSGGVPPTP